jgi:dolichyl-phosphate-mannose--protein O-mannosyl transferase
MIALSMKLLGDNAWGWRLPSLIFGIASIFIFYLLMKRMSRNAKFGLLATFLYSFDNLVFVHSRIACLDIFVLTFMLLGFYWYFGNRMAFAAISMGIGTLCKIGGFYGYLTLVVYHFLREIYRGKKKEKQKIRWYDKLGWLERFSIIYGLTVFVLLFLLDRLFAGYENPIDHLIFIAQYTAGLIRDKPVGIESYPWQWLINEVKIPYLSTGIQYKVGEQVVGEKTTVLFLGAMNPLIIYLCIPALAYVAYKYWKKGGAISLFILVWFASTYLPFYPLSIILHRIMYLFYFLNTVPAVCAAIAYVLIDRKVPRFIIILYAVGVLAAFIALFPFKTVP